MGNLLANLFVSAGSLPGDIVCCVFFFFDEPRCPKSLIK